jgi:flagellar biosynthesis/type III secretory pathway protein FliH
MKKIICILTLLISLSFTSATDYCDGWEEGYCEGFKDVKGRLAWCPVTPLCPLPEVYQNTYKDGYNRGFKKGRKDAKDYIR